MDLNLNTALDIIHHNPDSPPVGWYFDSPEGRDRFESEGEFFHCMIDKAIYQ